VGILARSGRNLAAGAGSVNDRRRLSARGGGGRADRRDLPGIVGVQATPRCASSVSEVGSARAAGGGGLGWRAAHQACAWASGHSWAGGMAMALSHRLAPYLPRAPRRRRCSSGAPERMAADSAALLA